jgi:hypothetical protein
MPRYVVNASSGLCYAQEFEIHHLPDLATARHEARQALLVVFAPQPPPRDSDRRDCGGVGPGVCDVSFRGALLRATTAFVSGIQR